jgi:hypothetical protein
MSAILVLPHSQSAPPAETLQLVRLLLPEDRDHSIILPKLEAEAVHQHFRLSHGVLIVNAIKIDPTRDMPCRIKLESAVMTHDTVPKRNSLASGCNAARAEVQGSHAEIA